MKVVVSTEVVLPAVPNFIRTGGRNPNLPLSAFCEEALREIGQAWTRALIEKARQMREGEEE